MFGRADTCQTDSGCPVTPLAQPKRRFGDPQIGPVLAILVVAQVLKFNAFRCSAREITTTRRLRQRSQRISKAGCSMRHSIEPARARSLANPVAAPLGADTFLCQQMFAALYRAAQHVGRPDVAIKS